MIASMFEVPIINLQVQNWPSKKQQLFNIIKLINETIIYTDTIYTDYFTSGKNYSKNIAEIFLEELATISTLVNSKLAVDNSWFQVAKQHNYHGPHTHGVIGYSVVCYIQYDKNLHSGITLLAPFSNPLTGDCITYSPPIGEGTLLCFPSTILHYTEPNRSSLDRIVLSFNLKPR